jgi:lipoprotein NlpI
MVMPSKEAKTNGAAGIDAEGGRRPTALPAPPDPTKRKGQVCEANFYGGELALRVGAKDEATRQFRLAANDCPKSFGEWLAANAELKALGGTR